MDATPIPGPYVIDEEGTLISHQENGDLILGHLYLFEDFPCLGHIDDEAELDRIEAELSATHCLIAASFELLEYARCEEDLALFHGTRPGDRGQFIEKWLPQLDALSPREDGMPHQVGSAWARYEFERLPAKLRKKALAKVKGE